MAPLRRDLVRVRPRVTLTYREVLCGVALGVDLGCVARTLGDTPLPTDETEGHIEVTYGYSTTDPLAPTSGGTGGGSGAEGTDATASGGGSGSGSGTGSSGGGVELCRGACGSPGCGVCPSFAPVEVGGYTIDAHEVTYAQYQAFVDVRLDPALQIETCLWNDTFVPVAQWPPEDALLGVAVVYVDWCDAAAYCGWLGGRLCGKIGGGPNEAGSYRNPAKSQWYAACSQGGLLEYPYGDAYDKDACIGADAGLTQNEPVPTRTTCEGGYPGVFDLSGNVYEWTDECDGETSSPRAVMCRRRGGSVYSDQDLLRCSNGSKRPREHVSEATGFRCCYD